MYEILDELYVDYLPYYSRTYNLLIKADHEYGEKEDLMQKTKDELMTKLESSTNDVDLTICEAYGINAATLT